MKHNLERNLLQKQKSKDQPEFTYLQLELKKHIEQLQGWIAEWCPAAELIDQQFSFNAFHQVSFHIGRFSFYCCIILSWQSHHSPHPGMHIIFKIHRCFCHLCELIINFVFFLLQKIKYNQSHCVGKIRYPPNFYKNQFMNILAC